MGEPNSSRHAVASAVSGFHSAIWRSPSGRPSTGTKIPDRNITGNITLMAIPSTPSGSLTVRPSHTPTQVTANAIRISSANAPIVSVSEPCGAQPTSSPQAAMTTSPRHSSASSATARPAIADPRPIGSARNRSIRPERMSVATPIDTPGSIPIIVWAKIPDTR